MDQDWMTSPARNVEGKMQDALGRTTADIRTQPEGAANQLQATAEKLYGQARESISDLAEAARDAGSSLEVVCRKLIEQQPYKAVAIALAIGWFLGRLHRPV
jgi:uncharacterized protein YjbJ (UPF0337 family)